MKGSNCGEFGCQNKAVVLFKLKCGGVVTFCSEHAKNSNKNYLFAKQSIGITED